MTDTKIESTEEKTKVSIEERILHEYEEYSNKHIECVREIITSSKEIEKDKSITVVGIVDGFNSILAKQMGLTGDDFDESGDLCSKMFDIIEKEKDKVKAMVITSKLCSEMLAKISIANAINKEE